MNATTNVLFQVVKPVVLVKTIYNSSQSPVVERVRSLTLFHSYRIHLSPGSRRNPSARARADAKKRSSLSSCTTADSPPATARSARPTSTAAAHTDDAPDSPPPLARATVLPRPLLAHPHAAHARSHSSASASASASASSSNASSPHSSYASASASPQQLPSSGVTSVTTTASPFMNVLGLSHERTHSPHASGSASGGATDFAYTDGVYQHRALTSDAYPLAGSSSSFGSSNHASLHQQHHNQHSQTHPNQSQHPSLPVLPPIHSIQHSRQSSSHPTPSTDFHTMSLGLGRVPQHPGPYPSYESNGHHTASAGSAHANTSASAWSHSQDTSASYTTSGSSPWWGNVGVGVGGMGAMGAVGMGGVGVGVGVGVGAGRAYASPFGAS